MGERHFAHIQLVDIAASVEPFTHLGSSGEIHAVFGVHPRIFWVGEPPFDA
jgi:hypothetical protein